jgi:hypothetical protein
VHPQRLTPWIIGTMLICAVLGGWWGHHIGGGGTGNMVLFGATCGVLGSFLPGTATKIWARLRGRNRPRQGAA